jgi:twitching motility two-component system response regulator PilG
MNSPMIESTESAKSSVPFEELTIMVIDDSKTIIKTADILLTEQGCQVLSASDGFEALPMIASEKPDLIFVDIMMPRLDGYQTCALIKANPEYQHIPVIMLSSKDGIFDMARGRLAGSESYITKPFTRNDLLEAIEAHASIPIEEASPEILDDKLSLLEEALPEVSDETLSTNAIEIPELDNEEVWELEDLDFTKETESGNNSLADELAKEFEDLELDHK